MALTTTTGQPTDATGATGDYAIDPVAHYIYGPKTNTWSGTASSLAGPSGPGLVYGQGAPTNAQGSIGQGYLDLLTGNFYGPKASNGAWGNAVSKIQGAAGTSALTGAGSPTTNNVVGVAGQSYLDTTATVLYVYANGGWGTGTNLIGATGAAGVGQALTFGTQSYGIGTVSAFVASTTFSATTQEIPIPGSTMGNYFFAPSACSLVGLTYYNSSSTAVTVELYDKTASKSVFTLSIVNNTTANTGGANNASYTPGTYAMTAGNQHVWRATGTAAAQIYVQPTYYVPSVTVQNASFGYVGALTDNQTYASSTYVVMRASGGATSTGPAMYYRSARPAYFTNATFVATGTASVTFYMNNNSVANVYATPVAVTASNSPYTVSLPVGTTGSVPLAANTSYQWNVAGSGTGNVSVTMQVVQ